MKVKMPRRRCVVSDEVSQRKVNSRKPKLHGKRPKIIPKVKPSKRKLPSRIKRYASEDKGKSIVDIWRKDHNLSLVKMKKSQILTDTVLDKTCDGLSYNPDPEKNKEHLIRIGLRELKVDKREGRLQRWKRKMRPVNWRNFIEEMREGLVPATDEPLEEEAESFSNEVVKKPSNRPKTEKKKFKRKLALVEARRRAREKAERARAGDLSRIGEISKTIEKEEEQREERLLMKKFRNLQIKRTRRLGRNRYSSPDRLDYQVNPVSGCLRTLEPEGDLMMEKRKEFEKRNMVVPVANKRTPRKRRGKKVSRRT